MVVEFGTAAHQDTIDRYVNGDPVSHADLRKVWSDAVGFPPVVMGQMYADFFASVRKANRGRPRSHRIRVWLAGPAADWHKIKTWADLAALIPQRDSFPAALIEQDILAKHRKSLIIFGAGHLQHRPGRLGLKDIVDTYSPGQFFVITPYLGFKEPGCSTAFEATRHQVPALISPPPSWPGCTPVAGIPSDATLYYGPAATLTQTRLMTDLYLDPAYSREMTQRARFLGMKDWNPTAIRRANQQPRVPYQP